ncbi:MAG: peptidoglycan DD-metalloendopeptidase family protein [Deinococcus sp.]|nr:peptidoglycan DD-metalloendopeptidase family protein [Deinococcus sp.]
MRMKHLQRWVACGLVMLFGAVAQTDFPLPTGFIVPVPGAHFSTQARQLPGAPRPYRNGVHQGFDFYNGFVGVPVHYGDPVVAVALGTVIRLDRQHVEMTREQWLALASAQQALPTTSPQALDAFRGRQVWLDHGKGVVSRYAHLSGVADGLSVGDQVTAGTVVGFIGNSGTLDGANGTKLGAHLHFELWLGEHYLGQDLSPEQTLALVAQVFTGPAPEPMPAVAVSAEPEPGLAVQVAAFQEAARAQALADRLRQAGLDSYLYQPAGSSLTRVRIRVSSRSQADEVLARLASEFNLKGLIIQNP